MSLENGGETSLADAAKMLRDAEKSSKFSDKAIEDSMKDIKKREDEAKKQKREDEKYQKELNKSKGKSGHNGGDDSIGGDDSLLSKLRSGAGAVFSVSAAGLNASTSGFFANTMLAGSGAAIFRGVKSTLGMVAAMTKSLTGTIWAITKATSKATVSVLGKIVGGAISATVSVGKYLGAKLVKVAGAVHSGFASLARMIHGLFSQSATAKAEAANRESAIKRFMEATTSRMLDIGTSTLKLLGGVFQSTIYTAKSLQLIAKAREAGSGLLSSVMGGIQKFLSAFNPITLVSKVVRPLLGMATAIIPFFLKGLVHFLPKLILGSLSGLMNAASIASSVVGGVIKYVIPMLMRGVASLLLSPLTWASVASAATIYGVYKAGEWVFDEYHDRDKNPDDYKGAGVTAASNVDTMGSALGTSSAGSNWYADQQAANDSIERGLSAASRSKSATTGALPPVVLPLETFRSPSLTPSTPYANSVTQPASRSPRVAPTTQNYGRETKGVSGAGSTKQFVGLREAWDLYTVRSPGVRVDGVPEALQARFLGLARDYYIKTGKKLPVTDASRSREEQQALRNSWLTGKPGANPANPVGDSWHEYGMAFDTSSAVNDDLEKSNLLRKWGFNRLANPKERHHLQPVELRGAAKVSDLGYVPKLQDVPGYGGGGGSTGGGSGANSTVNVPSSARDGRSSSGGDALPNSIMFNPVDPTLMAMAIS